jgi:hypothetical protein
MLRSWLCYAVSILSLVKLIMVAEDTVGTFACMLKIMYVRVCVCACNCVGVCVFLYVDNLGVASAYKLRS